ncbi:unnamed protein product [Hymenolepis diminuta]|uniref:Uncharacterized protein n=1 Tax=Hymenolepis diminuta TaxID=6216 RepID=A0A564YKP9_HYMDI|nr:unnamed protein product [Hymenolepis diminuta]VUZ47300.1 unnamed protein product [Hymenolepis diminuta]
MLGRGLTQVTHIKLPLFSGQQHTLVRADSYTSSALSLSLLLVVASLNTFLVYSTLGVLLHNCC